MRPNIMVGGEREPSRWPVWVALIGFGFLIGLNWYERVVAVRRIDRVLVIHHRDLLALGTHVKCTIVTNEEDNTETAVCPAHRYHKEEEPVPTATPEPEGEDDD